MDTYVLDYMVRTLINKIWLLPVLIGLCFLSSAILVSADETDFEDNDTWEEELYIEPLEVVEDPLPETSVEEPVQEASEEVTEENTSSEEPVQETSSEVTEENTSSEEPVQETSAAESTQSPNTSIDGDPAVDDFTLHNDNILLTASLYVMSGLLVSMGLIKIML